MRFSGRIVAELAASAACVALAAGDSLPGLVRAAAMLALPCLLLRLLGGEKDRLGGDGGRRGGRRN
jgi:hypothetical protein